MKIVINRSDAIGDMVLTLPLAQIIKQHYPDAKVYFLVSPLCSELLINSPFIDGVITYDHHLNAWLNFRQLRFHFKRLQIDHYLFVGGHHFPTIVARFCRIKFCAGHCNTIWSWPLLRPAIHQRRSQVKMHEALYNIKLLELIGIPFPRYLEKRDGNDLNSLSITSPLSLASDEKEQSLKIVKKIAAKEDPSFEWSDKFIIIHPGMRGHTLNWPPIYYLRLVAQLVDYYASPTCPTNIQKDNLKYIFSFTSNDAPYIDPITHEIKRPKWEFLKSKVFFLDGGKIGLRNYLGFLSQAAAFVGPSTGTTHLANALGIKVVAIYSPLKVQSANRWGPFYSFSKAKIVTPNTVCSEIFSCNDSQCASPSCMQKISVEMVGEEVVKMLE